MMKVMLPLMLLLLVGNVHAKTGDTKHFSDDRVIYELKKEVRMLRKDIQRLEVLILKLSMSDSIGNVNDNAWGCYLNDLNAGGVYGTGRTEAEAKGKTLEKCKRKDGMCFETQLECSVDNGE
ncbi:hypothetical protein [Photobacterium nomapromontoriensis]|uniref:hypothetical protein n=1 Tax=Photobacterium nomapromontoriensis TaxID=2910237 RepID=UPI003D0E43AC